MNGQQSLAFVRQRHQEADQDLGRMRNQQKFLSTLAHQAASPSTVLNPFKLYPVIRIGPGHAHRGQEDEPAEPRVDVLGDEGRHRRQRKLHHRAHSQRQLHDPQRRRRRRSGT